MQQTHVYTKDRVLRVEAAGFRVIGGLLEAFFNAVSDVFAATDKGGTKRNAPIESEKLF